MNLAAVLLHHFHVLILPVMMGVCIDIELFQIAVRIGVNT